MMTLTMETLKNLAMPALENIKHLATPKMMGLSVGTLLLGSAIYKFYNSQPGIKMRSKIAGGIKNMAENAIGNCDTMMAAYKKHKVQPVRIKRK